MLDQENSTKLDNPTTDIANDTNHAQETNGNTDARDVPDTTNGSSGANPLSEHDYCSPNKSSSRTSKMSDSSNGPTNQTSHGDNIQADLKLAQTEEVASSSSSPSKMNNCGLPDNLAHLEDELQMSDCSSSSISSDESDKNLIISQDATGRSLAPKDTPSVARAKLARRLLLKTESERGKKRLQDDSKQQGPRARRPRTTNNTSVTDKSQWITGEQQIDSALSEHIPEAREKRQRKEVHNPEFSNFTSSDYSSSDAESDQESEEWDEDDPNRPWCNCNKPDDGTFMISCDCCKYWFHGNCVGVVKSLSDRWVKENKEWHCSDCQEALESGIPREKIPPRIAKKPKQSKSSNKRRGRPRKSSTTTREPSARLSLRSAKKTSSSHDTRVSSRRSSTKSAGSESFNQFEHPDRLKELIRERKKAFFLKHRLSEQLKAEKMKEMGVGRRSLNASLGESLDTLASTTNSPNMNNLPINIKSEHKERSKPNIVLQINKKESSSEPGGQRLVTTIVKKREDEVSEKEHEKESSHRLVTTIVMKRDTDVKSVEKEPDRKPEKEMEPSSVTTIDEKCDDVVDKTVEKEPERGSEGGEVQNQPKRLRISIDTKLDPSSLSRLREPLIKPTEQAQDSAEFIPTMNSPNADPIQAQTVSPNAEEDDDDQELYDPETSTMIASDKDNFEPPLAPDSVCWSGTVQMHDVKNFNASAKPISGNANFIRNKLGRILYVVGRIAPDQIISYIKALKSRSSTNPQILLVQLHPLLESDKSNFDAFFDYLYTRNRCAVVDCTANSKVLKDFYILPIHEKSHIPDVLMPMTGPGLDRSVPNCLMGVLVKARQSKPESSNVTTYTPKPINQ